mmetsp:Transcript_45432/g.98895  ORF Transcript_45432/g.98895 Transcript_45432/m.98895 type:complete len:276 (+) Transcript_45432:369-1196(+)
MSSSNPGSSKTKARQDKEKHSSQHDMGDERAHAPLHAGNTAPLHPSREGMGTALGPAGTHRLQSRMFPTYYPPRRAHLVVSGERGTSQQAKPCARALCSSNRTRLQDCQIHFERIRTVRAHPYSVARRLARISSRASTSLKAARASNAFVRIRSRIFVGERSLALNSRICAASRTCLSFCAKAQFTRLLLNSILCCPSRIVDPPLMKNSLAHGRGIGAAVEHKEQRVVLGEEADWDAHVHERRTVHLHLLGAELVDGLRRAHNLERAHLLRPVVR